MPSSIETGTLMLCEFDNSSFWLFQYLGTKDGRIFCIPGSSVFVEIIGGDSVELSPTTNEFNGFSIEYTKVANKLHYLTYSCAKLV
jgi:hypothetical protein